MWKSGFLGTLGAQSWVIVVNSFIFAKQSILKMWKQENHRQSYLGKNVLFGWSPNKSSLCSLWALKRSVWFKSWSSKRKSSHKTSLAFCSFFTHFSPLLIQWNLCRYSIWLILIKVLAEKQSSDLGACPVAAIHLLSFCFLHFFVHRRAGRDTLCCQTAK